MDLENYRIEAHKTSKETKIFGSKLLYPLLGLPDEVGEIMGKIKKRFRDAEFSVTEESILNDAEFIKSIRKELGDVLWYVAETATVFGFNLNEIGQENLDKLNSRKERGVIGGSGDNR